MKYSRLGNDDMEQFVLDHRGEPYSGGFINYCIYLVDAERYKAERYAAPAPQTHPTRRPAG